MSGLEHHQSLRMKLWIDQFLRYSDASRDDSDSDEETAEYSADMADLALKQFDKRFNLE